MGDYEDMFDQFDEEPADPMDKLLGMQQDFAHIAHHFEERSATALERAASAMERIANALENYERKH